MVPAHVDGSGVKKSEMGDSGGLNVNHYFFSSHFAAKAPFGQMKCRITKAMTVQIRQSMIAMVQSTEGGA